MTTEKWQWVTRCAVWYKVPGAAFSHGGVE
jgi:hypothetical protein